MNNQSNTAYHYLVKLLSKRDYSEHKLIEKLREKEFQSFEIEGAIAEIKSRGFLRADLYAESKIKGLMEKGYSPDYIRQRLDGEQITVTNEIINNVFVEYQITPEDQIWRLIQKKIPNNKKNDQASTELSYEEESKILRYLMSKGHDFQDSKKVMKKMTEKSHF